MNSPEAQPQYFPYLTRQFWKETGLDQSSCNTFIETGCYRGAVLEFMKSRYRCIHSIELSEKWYQYCRDKFRYDSHVHLHHGDSVELLPIILNMIDDPAIVFLDAHYSGGSTAKGDHNCDSPLLSELLYLKTRTADDIIIIDDISFFGQKGGWEPDRIMVDGNQTE